MLCVGGGFLEVRGSWNGYEINHHDLTSLNKKKSFFEKKYE